MKNLFTTLVALSSAGVLVANGLAQGTAFTYQGRLNQNGAADRVYDLRFKLFDAATNGDPVGRTLELDNVPVNNGLFSVLLDFGNEDGEVFNGQPRWLEIAVRPGASSGAYATLAPRQLLTPTPYAIAAGTVLGPVPDARLSTNVAFLNSSPTFSGTVTARGNLAGAQLNVGSGHELSASFSTIAGGQSNTIASGFFSAIGGGFGNTIRYNDFYSIIGGGYQNSILFGASESTIGGGSLNAIEANAYRSIIGGGSGNRIQDTAFSSTIAGGYFNLIGPVAIYSTIAGGNGNTILTNAQYSTIGGGGGNVIEANTRLSPLQGSFFGTIGGGFLNRIQDGAYAASIVGGYSNRVGISAAFASLGGGEQNSVGEEANHATISGGFGNMIQGGADWGVVAGGSANVIGAGAAFSAVGGGSANSVRSNADWSVISGGLRNTIGSNAQFAAIPGGRDNSVAGLYGFAAGRRARANHDGTFVWADSANADATSTGSNQFLIRASGGVGINTNAPAGAALNVAGTVRAAMFEGAGGPLMLSTRDNQPLELKVNSQRALRLEPAANGPNIIGGGSSNSVAPGVAGATIGGGGGSFLSDPDDPGLTFLFNAVTADFGTVAGGLGNSAGGMVSTIGGGRANFIESNAVGSTIGGGTDNAIGEDVPSATVAGGLANTIGARSSAATIGGGALNEIGRQANVSTIGGGYANQIGSNLFSATISGGIGNSVGSEAGGAVIGGGENNRVENAAGDSTIGGGGFNYAGGSSATIGGGYSNVAFGVFSTVPGGFQNSANAAHSLAAGHRAKADHPGAFVWADSTDADMASTETNQFTVRASGGVRFLSSAGAATGVELAPGSGAWSTLSDRQSKTNFVTIEPREILARVAALPIQAWNYKSQDPAIRHLGPTAQDFRAAFRLGENDRTISTLDADGVALAAIQGLNQKLEQVVTEKDAEIRALKTTLAELRAVLEALAQKSEAER